ncbi:MarR family winged helix-turn-helix transcriptional regulator [Amycolatopsis taiwanensis]|uniref:MarR family transcriptional regulator n=1 Tax=Amycolatopsis taiwanensis TaxID=342230 RepID=A0A9W6R8C3_9PSEU|nr:MarR family transcriptional regulator [Amycolatopsis taiwanensis]GLY71026.1 MarR family transcriptional regulator [Amycolatopsis taiwanensis]
MSRDRDERARLVSDLYGEERTGATRAVLFHAAVAARAGLNITDVSCLGVLDKEGPMSAGQLAERVGLTRGGAITAVLDRMERAGLVRRRPDRTDRRRAIVELVRDGTYRKVELMLGEFGEAFLALIEDYSDDQLETLLDFSRRANEILHVQTVNLKSGSRPEKSGDLT